MMRGYSKMRVSGCTGLEQQEGDTYLLEEADLWTSKKNYHSTSDSTVSGEASTFVTAQNHLRADVQNWRKDQHLRWFKAKEKNGGKLSPFCEGEAYRQSIIEAMMPSEFRMGRVASIREPIPQSREQGDDRSCQKPIKRGAFGIALQRAMSLREGGGAQGKESDIGGNVEEERPFVKDGEGLAESKVETAVRRAFAMKDASATASMALQRSTSEREHGSRGEQKTKEHAKEAIFGSDLPAALILKRANPNGWQGTGGSFEGRGGRCMQEERQWNRAAEEMQISPGEKRWEEAAEDEERRARGGWHSQSMRCEKLAERVALAAEEDEEWALYTRSGYLGLRPPARRKGAEDWCCAAPQRRIHGPTARSFSMREAAPLTVVLDCNACGSALHGGAAAALPARLLCSCCASSSTSFGPSPPLSKKKGGVLQACRRLLGLARKRPIPSAASASG